MSKFIFQRQWNWVASGIAIGFIFLMAVFLVKPIGVSTQFVILDGIVWDAVDDDVVVKDEKAKKGYSSPNAYLNKSGGKYAKNVAKPVNYSFIFVVAMLAGGLFASLLQASPTDKKSLKSPQVWRDKYGHSLSKHFFASFLGGVLVLFGARLAGGCTSGHMISGMMQTSISGYLFAVGAFIIAVPVAIIMYRVRS
ncbi:MAG TPA: hypothetical protein EYH38_12270 [Leucothrix sp.]|nr:hypothetical protein [Leucothrix sp.]